MFCKKCGAELQENSVFCNICGEKVDNDKEELSTTQENVSIAPIVENNNELIKEEVSTNQIITSEEKENNEINQTPNNIVNPKKKSNVPFIIILIILILIIIALSVFICINLISDDTASNSNNSNSTSVPDSSNNNSKPTDDKKITVDNFEFTLPEGYLYKAETSGYSILDSEKTVVIQIQKIINKPISECILNSSKLKEGIENLGYTIKNYSIKSFGAMRYLSYESVRDGKTSYFYVAQLDSSNVASGALSLSNNTTEESAYTKLNQILVTAKNNSSESFTGEIQYNTEESTFTKELQ